MVSIRAFESSMGRGGRLIAVASKERVARAMQTLPCFTAVVPPTALKSQYLEE